MALRAVLVSGLIVLAGGFPLRQGFRGHAASQGSGAAVPAFGGNAQHTSLYETAAASLDGIRWTTSIDLAATFRTTHYGAPLVTPANTVIVPVKTATDGFQISAHDGRTGNLKYQPLASDYVLPAHNWVLPYQPVLATHVDSVSGVTVTRLYYAGVGGTIFFVENPDQAPGPPTRRAFYGLDAFTGNVNGFTGTVFVNTPLTADRQGNVFFGFRVQGTAPAPLGSTQSGIARIAPDGSARFVFAAQAAGDPAIGLTSHNAAPALNHDETTLYVVVKSPASSAYGYLLGLDATTLQMRHRVFLRDPRNNRVNGASLSDDSTASPMVAPDGDVYFGVQGNPGNGSRGFLLRFSADLAIDKTPGAFGWDSTAAIVPSSMVPSYVGTSPYLLFTKYNNYAVADGDGVNRMALLDPSSTQLDPHPSAAGLVEMREVLTVIGPTPDATRVNGTFPNAVREWCINTAAVNPATRSIFAPNEDGFLYRWDLSTNSLSQAVRLTPGFGEPYVPTIVGPDGTVFTLNGGTLFAVGAMGAGPTLQLDSSRPDLRGGVDGETVTFTARVTGATGTVAFTDVHYRDQSVNPTAAELARVALTGGTASFTTATLAAGTHFITATLDGTNARATRIYKVHRHATTTDLTAAIGGNDAVTLTARVTGATSGAPTGMVTFDDGSRAIGQVPLNANGTATITASLFGGVSKITATYASDPIHAWSADTIRFPDDGPPSAPVDVTAAPGPDRGQITIRWRPNAAGEGVVAYEIWRTGQSGNTFSLVGTSTSDTFTDSVAKRRRPWRYYIIAKDDTGLVSAPSAEVRARPR
jgi:hypothetical protein